MTGWPARAVRGGAGRDDLFVQIGAFLADHGLSPEPAHYSFAHAVLSQPCSALAARVARLVDGGVRLTGADVAELGGEARAGAPVQLVPVPAPDPREPAPEAADLLLARAQHQMGGFADTVRAIHAQTQDFGRDLVAGAAALAASAGGIEDVAALTAAMIARVNDAEVRLADATREADELRSALDEARGSARTDPLTGLPNRRALDEAMTAITGATPLAICDVDHFKQVNDRFGHAAGDRVLRAIAQTLAEACEGHFVARYGGEELVVLMPGLTAPAAAATLDTARARIGARRLRLRDTEALIGSVTVSIGLALAAGPGDAVAALARADDALYRAKNQGRDRLCHAPEIGG